MTDPTQSTISKLLPELEKTESLSLVENDVLIHAPGFEDRTMAILDSVKSDGNARAILLDYQPIDDRNRLTEIREELSRLQFVLSDYDILTYHRFKPDDFDIRLQNRLKHHNANRVIVDISSMSKLAIMLILKVCQNFNLEVRILYTEAKKYGPSEDEFINAQQEKKIHQPSLQIYTGVYGVVRVDSLASVAMQGQPTAALVFMSFNDSLTQVLLNTIYPSRLFLINGKPPVHSWREKATAWIHEQVMQEWISDNLVDEVDGVILPERVTSTLDYRETVSLLLDLYWSLSFNHRILLAPAGSKMQAVGSYLVFDRKASKSISKGLEAYI